MENKLLLGAVAGDVIGSAYEWHPTKSMDFELFTPHADFTDDTVMTLAVADWLLNGGDLACIMQSYGRRYPHRGYGGRFRTWLGERHPQPYMSFGNGSAMRVSPVGLYASTLEEALELARISASVTHDHPEGIKGAQAIAACVYLRKAGRNEEEIKKYVVQEFGYDLDIRLEDIRDHYTFDVTCQGTVPESIIAFMESTDYESAIRLTVSLNGDADTMGAITGGIAEAFYKEIPAHIEEEVMKRLPDEFIEVMKRFYKKYIE